MSDVRKTSDPPANNPGRMSGTAVERSAANVHLALIDVPQEHGADVKRSDADIGLLQSDVVLLQRVGEKRAARA